jgi:hypothetical protein
MLTISYKNLWSYLSETLDEDEKDLFTKEVSDADKEALGQMDIKEICVDFSMSESHLGGDDVCNVAHDVVVAISEGYEVIVWYGDDAEVLIVGVRPGTIAFVD